MAMQRLQQRFQASDPQEVVWRYPCNLDVLQNALGVIVHTEYSRRLASQWYGDSAADQWMVIPHLRVPEHGIDRAEARRQLKLNQDDFVVCSFGMLAPGGVLARTHPAYEFRRGQLQMAQAVEQALEEKRHLIVEAGTGTGKTLAYLMPVIRSGKRVIISTGTKNLQEQLFYKDVPFLEHALYGERVSGSRLSVCYMKGRNNYLCRKKLYDLTDQPVLSGLEEIEQYRAIAAWEKTTSTGDRAELAELPEASAVWHKLDARAEACIGQKCSEWERCFVTEMRRRGMESNIIIVNHHLFFADLAIKLQADGAPDAGILPEAAAVIFDEAHELEDVAGNYFGISVSNLRVEDLARDVEASLQHNRMLSASLLGALESLQGTFAVLFFTLAAGGWTLRLRYAAGGFSGRKWRSP